VIRRLQQTGYRVRSFFVGHHRGCLYFQTIHNLRFTTSSCKYKLKTKKNYKRQTIFVKPYLNGPLTYVYNKESNTKMASTIRTIQVDEKSQPRIIVPMAYDCVRPSAEWCDANGEHTAHFTSLATRKTRRKGTLTRTTVVRLCGNKTRRRRYC